MRLKNTNFSVSLEEYIAQFSKRGKLNVFLNKELQIIKVFDGHYFDGSPFKEGHVFKPSNNDVQRRLFAQFEDELLQDQLEINQQVYTTVLIFSPFGKFLRLVLEDVHFNSLSDTQNSLFAVRKFEDTAEHDISHAILDKSFNYIYKNSSHVQIMDELLNQSTAEANSILELLSDVNRQEAVEIFQRVLEGESFVLERKFIDFHKQHRYFRIAYFPYIHDNELKGVTLIGEEISSRRLEIKKSWELLNFLRNIIDEAPMDIVVLDSKFRYVFIGKNTIQDEQLREWLIGKTDYDYCEYLEIDPSLAARRFERFKQLQDNLSKVVWIENFTNKNGEAKSSFRTFSPILNQEGKIGYVLGYSFDNTEKQHIERDYKEVREQFNSLFEQAPEALLLLDFEKQKYIAANAEAVNLFGYTKDELLHKKLGDLSPVDTSLLNITIQDVRSKIENAVHGKPTVFEWAIRTKSGQIIPCEVRVNRLPSNTGVLLRSSITDITHRKHAELKLRASEQKFRMLFDSNLMGILGLNKDYKIKEVNEAISSMLGYSKDELVNKSLSDISDVSQDPSSLEQILDVTPQMYNYAQRLNFYKKDGTLIHAEMVINLTKEIQDDVEIIATIKDITQEVEVQLALEESEFKYKSLFENSVQGILMVDTKMQAIVQANDMARTILGVNLAGKEMGSTVNLDYLQSTGETTQRVLEVFFRDVLVKGQSVLFVQVQNASGDVYDLSGVGYRLFVDNVEMVAVVFDDKTEENRQKRQLVNQQQLFQTFFDSSPTPMAMMDRDMNYVLVGKEWIKSYPTKFGEDIIGKNHYDLHPEVPLRWRIAHQKSLQGESIKNNKDYLDTENGREWFKWETRPWFDSKGAVGGVIIYSEIITDEILLLEERVEQEKRFKRLFENSSIGWMEIDYSAHTKEEVLAVLDYSDEELIEFLKKVPILNANEEIYYLLDEDLSGRSLYDFFLMMYKDRWKDFYRQELWHLKEGSEEYSDELELMTHDGRSKSIYISTRMPLQESFSSIIYGVLDISDLKSSTTALRESEARYRTIFESSNLGIIYNNKRAGLIKTNPAFERIMGYAVEQIYPGFENDILLQDYRAESDRNYKLLEKGKARQFVMEKQYIRNDGRVITARTASSGLYDTMHRHYGNVTIIEDISDLRIKEDRIRAQNDELIKINTELDQFVYSAAHDLRAPVANVMGLIQLLKLEKLTDDAQNYLNLQEQSLEKLDEFIRGIINYSRNSRKELEIQEIDLAVLMDELIGNHKYLPKAQGMQFSTTIDAPVPVFTDVQRLTIVMNNLLSNAIRYSDANKENREVRIRINASNSKIEFSFWDNGLGIPSNELGKIFDNFYRAHARSEGTGIGLYLVKETVKKLKGEISVQSEEGEWTDFCLVLKNFNPNSE